MPNNARDHAHSFSEARTWLETNASVVVSTVRKVARRRRLRPQDGEELLSQVFLHLLKDDCRALRAFRGAGSHAAYVATIVERKLMDMRIAEWGKWRPSAIARREGPAAVRFEQLVNRDGVPPSQARAMTGHADGAAESRRAPAGRQPRRMVGMEAIEQHHWEGRDPLELLIQKHRLEAGAQLRRRLKAALGHLGPTDIEILRMRHANGLPISQIARQLGLEQRTLYPRVVSLHEKLRRLVEVLPEVSSVVVERR